jgi:hypothetical protein
MCVFYLVVLFCVELAALRRDDPPSKESYRLCIGLRNWKSGRGPKSHRKRKRKRKRERERERSAVVYANVHVCVHVSACMCVDVFLCKYVWFCVYVSMCLGLNTRAYLSDLLGIKRHPKSQFCLPQAFAAIVLIQLDRATVAINTPTPSLLIATSSGQCTDNPLEFYTIIKRRISKLEEEKPQRQKLFLYGAGHSPAVTQWNWKLSCIKPGRYAWSST